MSLGTTKLSIDNVRFMSSSAWLLFILSPVLAELVSGSSPPKEFFNPVALFMQLFSYGSAAVLLREYAVRLSIKGWGKVFIALSMGFYIEGIVCKSYFSPQWVDFNFPLGYGRFFGLNIPWIISLEIYHAFASFLVPWMIVEFFLPQARNTKGLSNVALIIHTFLVVSIGIFGLLVMPMNKAKEIYHAGIYEIIMMLVPIIIILVFAKCFDHQLNAINLRIPVPHPVLVFIFTLICWVVFQIVICWEGPKHNSATQEIILQLISLSLIFGISLIWTNRLKIWHTYAIISAHLLFWSFIAIIQGLWPNNFSEDKSGMIVVGMIPLILIVFLWFRAKYIHNHPILDFRKN